MGAINKGKKCEDTKRNVKIDKKSKVVSLDKISKDREQVYDYEHYEHYEKKKNFDMWDETDNR